MLTRQFEKWNTYYCKPFLILNLCISSNYNGIRTKTSSAKIGFTLILKFVKLTSYHFINGPGFVYPLSLIVVRVCSEKFSMSKVDVKTRVKVPPTGSN